MTGKMNSPVVQGGREGKEEVDGQSLVRAIHGHITHRLLEGGDGIRGVGITKGRARP